jgi:thiamine-monophosphate kinase
MTEKRTEISTLGEFGLIERLAKPFSLLNADSLTGIGDDAAVIANGDTSLLLSTDLLVEGVHFDLRYMPLKHLGYKAVAVNVSDIAAMNGKPGQIVVSLGLSNRFSVEAVEELYSGIRSACEAYKVDLVGGDTAASPSGLILNVAILGQAARDKVVKRSGAKPTDIVCVTGDLGAAYLGLQVLEREKEVFLSNPDNQPDLEKYQHLVQRQLKPEARMDIIYDLEDAGCVPSAMIDVSDGLASDLFHICKQSGVGVRIFEDKLPIDHSAYETAVEFRIDPTTAILNGGEDYELLFTVSQKDYDKISKHPDIHSIGYVHEKTHEKLLITKQGTPVPLKAQGWDHFSS